MSSSLGSPCPFLAPLEGKLCRTARGAQEGQEPGPTHEVAKHYCARKKMLRAALVLLSLHCAHSRDMKLCSREIFTSMGACASPTPRSTKGTGVCLLELQ